MKTTDNTLSFIPATPVTPPRIYHPRPYTTYYYTGAKDKVEAWARVGRACTRETALRAAVYKVLLKTYNHVDVYDIDGIRCGIITRKGNTIKIVCV